MTEIVADGDSVEIINESDYADSAVWNALSTQHPEVAALVRWTREAAPTKSRHGNLFDRDMYVTPERYVDKIVTARMAAQYDDVVSNAIETTEALAFRRVSVDAEDEDERDVLSQIAVELDLDTRLREMWREIFVIGQVTVAMWWGEKSYRVRGRSEKSGVKRKRTFNDLRVPVGMTILDPLKVVPVGNLLFNKERLAYVADEGEMDIIQAHIEGRRDDDPIIRQLMVGQYKPDDVERQMLSQDGIAVSRLFLLNPANVWRHTDTRSQYERFAPVRMQGVFELLDLKHQLRAMDRAHLIGGTHFIVLIKKGSDKLPAKPEELKALQGQVRTLARVPVIVGDDRLSIEIITPKNDNTLDPARYNGIDARITARLYQVLMTGAFSSGTQGDDSIKLAKFIARSLESRRFQIKRSIEKNVLDAVYRKNPVFKERPELEFHPKRIALDFDSTFATMLQDLRDRGDISRETILEEVDYDQYTEFRRRKIEKERYDDTFQTMNPWGGGAGGEGSDPRTAGRRMGGTKSGGGAAPGTGQGQEPKNPGRKSDGKDRGDQ
jgi:hypothetical protein